MTPAGPDRREPGRILKRACLATAAVLGLGALANGAYMLVAPGEWYVAVPGVTTTGPFNQHFIRDIGLVYLFVGAAFLTGFARPRYRVVAWGGATIWLGGHALFHVWEVAAGICGPSALARDFPAVSLPAILGLLITCWAFADARRRSTPKETQE